MPLWQIFEWVLLGVAVVVIGFLVGTCSIQARRTRIRRALGRLRKAVETPSAPGCGCSVQCHCDESQADRVQRLLSDTQVYYDQAYKEALAVTRQRLKQRRRKSV